jgi:hypothetical protein
MSEEFFRAEDASTEKLFNMPASELVPAMMQVVQDYGLADPDEQIVLYDPPALRPEPQEAEKPMSPNNNAVDERSKEDPLQTLRQVKRFAKIAGGLKQAEEILKALELVTLPIPQLIAWIKVLREE